MLLGLLAERAGPKGALRGIVPLLSLWGPVLLLGLRMGGARALGRAPRAKQLAEGVCMGVWGLLGSLGRNGSILGKGVVPPRAGVWLGIAAGGNGDGRLLLAVGQAVGGCSRASKGAAAAKGILVARARGLLGVGATTCAQDTLVSAAAQVCRDTCSSLGARPSCRHSWQAASLQLLLCMAACACRRQWHQRSCTTLQPSAESSQDEPGAKAHPARGCRGRA